MIKFYKTFCNNGNLWPDEVNIGLSDEDEAIILNARSAIKDAELKYAVIEPPSHFIGSEQLGGLIKNADLKIYYSDIVLKCEGMTRHEYAEYRPIKQV
jgi:hypothetical protein